MTSENKLQANRLNAQRSTGPRTPEGKAAASLNAITHGLRARKAVMLIEDPEEFRRLCAELYDEWDPRSSTEVMLVEQMAVARWKLARLEALISNASLHSSYMHLAFRNPNDFRTEKGSICYPAIKDPAELATLRMLHMLEQHQARVQRCHDTAFETLQRLQAGRPRPTLPIAEPEVAEIPLTAAAGAASLAPETWLPQPGEDPEGPTKRRFGNTWLHPQSGLPEDVT